MAVLYSFLQHQFAIKWKASNKHSIHMKAFDESIKKPITISAWEKLIVKEHLIFCNFS